MVELSDLNKQEHFLLGIIKIFSKNFKLNGTIIQKLTFLANKYIDKPYIYDYEPNNFGPYSEDVATTLSYDKERGFINENYSLTDKGEILGTKIINFGLPEKDKIIELSMGLQGLSNDDIIYLVYKLYPEFTSESKIKYKVDSHILESFEIDIKKLSDNEIKIKGDKNHFIKVKKNNNNVIIVKEDNDVNGDR